MSASTPLHGMAAMTDPLTLLAICAAAALAVAVGLEMTKPRP